MKDYKQYIPKEGCKEWHDEYIEKLGQELLNKAIDFTYNRLYSLRPGQFYSLESFKVKDENLLVKIICMFISETQHYTNPKMNYVFDEEYTKIIRKE